MDKQIKIYLDKIIMVMKNDYPLFKNLKDYGFYDQLSEDELIYVLSGVFGEPVKYRHGSIYDENNNEIYFEGSDGVWYKKEFDENNNMIYYENSDGEWVKIGYDEDGNRIYYENSNGYWEKIEYDKNGNMLYFETSNGYWRKWEYDERGNIIYVEDSDGYIEDNK